MGQTTGHTVWSDTNCAFGLIGALALDHIARKGGDPTKVRFALRHDCACEIGQDHTESGEVLESAPGADEP